MRQTRVILTCVLATAILTTVGLVLAPVPHGEPGPGTSRPGPARPVIDSHSSLGAAITAAQARLRDLPQDWATWAQLGSAYVEQARLTGDPTYYPKADDALTESLRLWPDDNWRAMAGKGALANARNDFVRGLSWGRRAEEVNERAVDAQGVIVDALTHLGEYAQAQAALRRLLELQPGIAAFTRVSSDRELHGDVGGAGEAMRRALAQATEPAEVAFCQYRLGELAFNAGDPRTAASRYRAAVTADPRYYRAFAGLARAHAALGQTEDALAEYDRAVRALPLAALFIEYGDLLASLGRASRAQAQYDLAEAAQALFVANGGTDHLLSATFLADHDRLGEALDHARVEWSRHPDVAAADALAWALHRQERDEEALVYADIANSLSWRDATFRYHRGVIQAALGDDDAARDELAAALALNPHFDPVQAPIARELLSTLDAE